MTPKLNVRLLRRVQRAILKHPDQFEMSGYFQSNLWFRHTILPAGGCGAAACIAGWALHLASGRKRLQTTKKRESSILNTWDRAAESLGLPAPSMLFSEGKWPYEYLEAYKNAKTPRSRAKIAAARIELFIKSKGEQ